MRRVRRLKIRYELGRWWYDVDRGADLELLAADLARGSSASGCPATARLLRELGLLKLSAAS